MIFDQLYLFQTKESSSWSQFQSHTSSISLTSSLSLDWRQGPSSSLYLSTPSTPHHMNFINNSIIVRPPTTTSSWSPSEYAIQAYLLTTFILCNASSQPASKPTLDTSSGDNQPGRSELQLYCSEKSVITVSNQGSCARHQWHRRIWRDLRHPLKGPNNYYQRSWECQATHYLTILKTKE